MTKGRHRTGEGIVLEQGPFMRKGSNVRAESKGDWAVEKRKGIDQGGNSGLKLSLEKGRNDQPCALDKFQGGGVVREGRRSRSVVVSTIF